MLKRRRWGGSHQLWRWWAVGLLWLLSGMAAAREVDLGALPADGLALGPKWELLRDADHKLDLPAALRGDWQPSTASGEAVSFGYSAEALWLRLPLRNGSTEPMKAIFGLALAVGLYNLVIFLLLRDASFGWYVLFAGSIAASLACFTGIGVHFLWPDSPGWQQRGVNVPGSVAAIALMMFSRRMLGTPQTMPRLDVALRVLIALNVVLIPLLLGWFAQTAPFWAVCSASTAVVLLACGITGTLQRQRSAYFFVVAFSVLLVAVMLGHLRNLGVLPANLITSAGTQAGSAVDLLLLSLALADRYARMRADKEQAQAQALQAEQARVQTLTDSERALEARVLERTAALEAANRQLERMSQTDGLTGLANRRHFDAVLAAEWARSQRAGQPLGLGLLDADLFKAYNDQMGHVAGDDCLRQIAAVLSETIGRRSGELVARYGGEEFAFIVPGAGGTQMQALGERIVAALRVRALPHPASPRGHVTASIGLAAEVPAGDRRPELLVQAADEALYAAKAAGRDQVRLAREA